MATDIDGYSSDEDERPPFKPFRFFDLPSELRLRIYELILHYPDTVDLHPDNYYYVSRPLRSLLLTSRRARDEAERVFYTSNTFRVFPMHGRFFNSKKPLLTRMVPRHRAMVHTLELRLGPGFTKPPLCQNTGPKLGLKDCISLRMLKIFVECDPESDPIFAGFRINNGFYTRFCVTILQEIFEQCPLVKEVQFDGWPAVHIDSPLMVALLAEVKLARKRISFGPSRGWGVTTTTIEPFLPVNLGLAALDERLRLLKL